MYNYRPKDYIELIKGRIKDNPGDKQTVYIMFLENTNYAIDFKVARVTYKLNSKMNLVPLSCSIFKSPCNDRVIVLTSSSPRP